MVIAETRDLPTRQDCRHRRPGPYLIPDLPKANYDIWYAAIPRGSIQTKSAPGKTLNLKATPAPTKRRGNTSVDLLVLMLKIPDAKLFPGTGTPASPSRCAIRACGCAISRPTLQFLSSVGRQVDARVEHSSGISTARLPPGRRINRDSPVF
jgi:hypothetical protein